MEHRQQTYARSIVPQLIKAENVDTVTFCCYMVFTPAGNESSVPNSTGASEIRTKVTDKVHFPISHVE